MTPAEKENTEMNMSNTKLETKKAEAAKASDKQRANNDKASRSVYSVTFDLPSVLQVR